MEEKKEQDRITKLEDKENEQESQHSDANDEVQKADRKEKAGRGVAKYVD